MNIGRMNKRITLQQYVKIPDGQGGYSSEWVPVATVWAEFRKPRLETAEEAGTIISDLTREIAIRYRPDVRKGWRVVYDTKTFDVLHTYDYDKVTTILVCREVVK